MHISTMIAIGKSITHLRASLVYAQSKEKGILLDKNIVSVSPSEVLKEFGLFQSLNSRCARNTFSFVLSPTVEDGYQLSYDGFRQISRSFLSKMDLESHQYIAFLHQNTPHKHIHLYVNRISKEGIAYKDSYLSNRSSRTAELISQEMKLSTAKQIQKHRLQEKVMPYPYIHTIKEIAQSILSEGKISSIDGFQVAFNTIGRNVRSEAYYNKQGTFQGLRFYVHQGDKEIRLKASEIDPALSKKNLLLTLQKQRDLSLSLGYPLS